MGFLREIAGCIYLVSNWTLDNTIGYMLYVSGVKAAPFPLALNPNLNP